MGYSIVVHAGAGQWDGSHESEAVAGVREAAARAVQVLRGSGNALDAVIAAVVEMEDNPLFNAGTGSVLNLEAAVEMDAAVMTGHDLACGSVAALKRVRNPVLVALRQWSEEFDDQPDEIATILVDKEKGRPVRKLELYSQDGRQLTAADTALKPRPAARGTRRASS